MSAAELSEFLAAMDIVRQANAALLDAAAEDDAFDESREFAGVSVSPTIH